MRAEPTDKRKTDAVEIGSARQLFLDDRLVDLGKTRGIARTLNQPECIRRVLQPDQPWEALGFIFYCSVVDDGGTAKLYYGSYDAEKKKHFCLATSRDGLTWQRPELGVQEFQGSTQNNLLAPEAVEASVLLDPHAPSDKRYRLLFTHHWPDPARAGVYVASSSDGIHWEITPERVLPFVPDSQPSAVWDPRLQKFVVYLRTWNPGRAVARVAVSDLAAPWPYDQSVPPLHIWGKDKVPTLSRELPMVMACDAQDPANVQLYTSEVVYYPFAPDVYLAFPAAYRLFKGPEWKGRALNTNDGTFDVEFAASRDGIAWQRWRRPYVAAGFCDGLNLRLVNMGQGMLRRGRLLHQYFVGWPHTHGRPVVWDRDPASRAAWLKRDLGGIYCATQRVDGFVSLDASPAGGTLTTRPLVFAGNRLRLNLHTAGIGSATVALLDERGNPIPGFAAEDCETIRADAIDHEVRWKTGADVGALAGKPLLVQCSMRSAKLYALQFGSDLPPEN
ncbi:MAG TPA: hypothetical protein VIK18_16880 [Pirellulales bacterium]